MSAINPNRYPVDLTGVAPSNAVVNEAVTLNGAKRRVFVPQNAPYFGNSMVITDANTGHVLTSNQWKPFCMIASASMRTDIGFEVYSVAVITDQSVSNNLLINYQTIGGDFVCGFDNILQLLTDLSADARPITWPNVLDAPASYPSNQHYHSLNDTIGWEYVVSFLEQLKTTIVLGDSLKRDAVLAYIDEALANSDAVAASLLSNSSPFGLHVNNQNNPHGVNATTVNLGSVQNYRIATSAEAYAGTMPNAYMTADLVGMVVRNAVNGGIDAHIARTDNPHGTTAVQIGLGNLWNYGVATLAEITNPDQANPKYVINTSLGQYLSGVVTTLQGTITSTFATITQSINQVGTQATAASAAALAASTAAQAAITKNTAALNQATTALSVANANKQSVTNALSTVNTQFDTYVAQAVDAARNAGYAAGYAAGIAA